MAKSHLLRLLISVAAVAALVLTTAESDEDLNWTPATCKGSIEECMADGAGGEFEMDSEINRRILATSQYIGYRALIPGSVSCPRRGASYYNCQPSGPANPYTRTCSTATRCGRG
ncbi:hypothetical protein CASFOL_008980 [Castilleja foliolosa]|uniref:Rapid alkalinization factor-like n=1 Tax=Castilleja foliolosa TaxID=1961234 RepID=A0ABD3E112_9LAMI